MELIELKAVVNFAKPYRVAEGGSTNEGITINYLMTNTLKPYSDDVNGSQGYKSTKSSIPLSMYDKLVAVPGYYKLYCELGVSSNGQPQLKPVDLEFLQYCDIRFSDSADGLSSSNQEVKPKPDVKEKEVKK